MNTQPKKPTSEQTASPENMEKARLEDEKQQLEDSLTLQPVTAANRTAALALQVRPEQQGFIETVAQCLVEADQLPLWRPVGIYHGQSLIGFAMYGLWQQEGVGGRVWLDRLLIDQRHQGKGYAKPALRLLLRQIYQDYQQPEVFLSLYQENTKALGIYQAFGFEFNGELDLNGEQVMVLRLNAAGRPVE